MSYCAAFFLLTALPGMKANGQGSPPDPYIPSIVPPSPAAASLMKFTDVPVSPYTGTADVTVPIYTIHAKGIDVPVSVAYHTGGIRAKEESGPVGLGWALNAGGMISRTIMDQDDFNGDYFTSLIPQITGDVQSQTLTPGQDYLGSATYAFFCNDSVNTSNGPVNMYNAFGSGTVANDMEADQYSYNFPGHSGKFIIRRDGTVMLQKQENIRVQFQANGTSFTITDDQGNTFYFHDKEYAESGTGAGEAVSSWMLSQIVTQQNDSINFNYLTDSTWSFVVGDQNQSYRIGCSVSQGFFQDQGAGNLYLNVYLQSINFRSGQLQFTFDGNRTDLQNGKKLDAIKIYSQNTSGVTYLKENDFYYSYFGTAVNGDALDYTRLRLDSVKEMSGGSSNSPYYFTYNNPSDHIAKQGYGIDHWGFYNGKTGNSNLIPPFSGYTDPGVSQGSGNYYVSLAGAVRDADSNYNQAFILQQVKYPTGGFTTFTYQTNDYDLAKSTTTPTSFPQYAVIPSYQVVLNISASGTSTGTVDLRNITPFSPQPVGQNLSGSFPNLSMNVAYISNNNGQMATIHTSDPVGKLYFTLGRPLGGSITSDVTDTKISCPINSPECSVTDSISVDTGALYNWTAYIDPSIASQVSEIHLLFTFNNTQQIAAALGVPQLAGGLRVSAVTDYNSNGTVAKKRVYTYGYTQNVNGTPAPFSYGKLLSIPSYIRMEPINISPPGNSDYPTYCWSLTRFASSMTSLTSCIQGNIVGYDQVTETTVDPFTGADIGKTVYNYFNSPDSNAIYTMIRLPGVLSLGNSFNGLLLSKTEYSDNRRAYNKVHSIQNFYHTANRMTDWSCKYLWLTPAWATMACAFTSTSMPGYAINFYPSIKSERVLLDSTREYTYDQLDTTQYALNVKRYYYDNPKHYQATRIGVNDSKGDTLIDKIKYAQDFIPIGQQATGNMILDSMIGRNMVSEPIEKQDSFYYAGSSAGYITGAQLSLFKIASTHNTIIPDRSYKLAINSPVTNFQPFALSGGSTSQDSRYRQMVSFDQYDSYGDIQQYTPIDQNPVTFVWDYLHTYPIAQVKNAALADVAATSFEADGTGNWTYTGSSTADTSSITGSLCYNLGQTGGNITKSGLASGTTYVLSYWTKNSSPLSIAGNISGYPIKGKTIRGWTYYEHEFTGQTAITVSGTGYIDELRLYPATAQMTTYTYSPLVGTTSACDVDNRVTYYFYDGYQRLKWIKDQDGNIVKTIQYHYANQH